MAMQAFARRWFAVAVVVWAAVEGGRAQTQDVQPPVNSGANPYRVIRDWGQLTLEGRPWGGSNGVAIDRDGRSVWATDRCSQGIAPGCLGTKANPVHLFDPSGKEVRSFGGGMFVWPHGIHVDRDGNVWVSDARVATPAELKKFPGEDNKGSVVVKFSPDGKVLMTLGKPGVRGNPPEALTDPNDVVTDPGNGDIYVAEKSHQRRGPESGRAHLGVRSQRQVPAHHRQDRNRAGRIPHAAHDQVRYARTPDRRRPPQPPHPDPDEGGQVSRRVPGVRPRERDRDRRQRHALCGQFRNRPKSATRAG